MAKIAQSLVELIGKTPLLELSKVEKKQRLKARVLVKLEYLNPGRSVKDRVGYALIEQAEKQGLLGRNTVIIEPTSGNTGVGLALVAARRGYKLILTMPDSMSIERRTLLRSLGARLVLTPAYEGMPGAIRKAQELASQTDAFLKVLLFECQSYFFLIHNIGFLHLSNAQALEPFYYTDYQLIQY